MNWLLNFIWCFKWWFNSIWLIIWLNSPLMVYSDNMELLKQQQHLLQLRYHAYQQMLQQQQQQQQQQQPIVSPRVSPTGTPAASPAATSSAAASAAAAAGVGDVSLTSPLLYMGLFGFSHMLQSLDAQTQYLRQIANPQITSVPVIIHQFFFFFF